jgi:hypothetical protein
VTARDAARVLLAAVRIANGSASLLAPAIVARRLGAAPETADASLYPLRLFGIRTVVVGAELLLQDPSVRRTALDGAVVIHASDTLAALLGGLRKELPRRQAAMLTLLSAGNTALALVARSGLRRGSASPARAARG